MYFFLQNNDQFKDLNFLMNGKNNHEYKSLDICIKELLADPHVAFITDSIYAKELQKLYCASVNLLVLDDTFFPIYASMPHRKNFTLAPLISQKLLTYVLNDNACFQFEILFRITQFHQNGLFKKWMDKHSVTRKFCEIFECWHVSTNSKPLNVIQIAGAFILFLFGITVGIIGFVTETYKLHIWLRYKCKTLCQRTKNNDILV